MRAPLLTLALAGCSFSVIAPGTGADGGPDTPLAIDAPPGVDACVSFAAQLDSCALPASSDLTLSGTVVLDTDAGTLVDGTGAAIPATLVAVATSPGGVSVMVLVADDLTLGATTWLRATGSRPLALVARGTLRFDGNAFLDVGDGGAGARTSCAPGAGAGADDSGGAAGGGGGGFGAAGGKGGNGDADNGQSTGGAGGGFATAAPLDLLGGCPGATGGRGQDPGGAGAAGGGAIYVVAGGQLELQTGSGISAGGGGGGGGQRTNGNFGDAGGGGGGAGGMIVVEAPRIRSAGALIANGGGGGEGSGNSAAGTHGIRAQYDVPQALGGAGNSPTGTDGGNGGNSQTPTGASVSGVQNGGGGGGGGGVGFVRVVSPDAELGTLVSPSPG